MTWFAPIRAISFENDVLVLQVKSQFIVEYIEENYLTLLSKVLFRMFGPQTKLEYRVQIDSHTDAGVNIPSDVSQAPVAPPVLLQQPDLKDEPDFNSQLNPSYNFESFVQGESNKLARTVALSIAAQPGRGSFNPLFVYGGSGVGKTHLANAIGNDVKRLMPQKRVLYVSANTFQLQYQDAAAHNHIPDFLLFYQTIDVLIVDDVQEWEGKPGTQNTFFHIFNHLFMNGRRIILASDRSPVELKDMNDRLLSRFSCGLIAELEKPNEELCVDILKSKIRRDALSIPDDVITYIAQTANGSVRDLEGVINSLLAYSVVYSCPINMRLVERIIQRAIKTDNSPLTVDDILEKVCNHFGVTQSAIYSKSRKRDYVVPRQLTMFFTAKYTKMPASRIGKLIGGRDHSTVIHSCSQIEKRIKVDKAFEDEVISIENSFKLKK